MKATIGIDPGSPSGIGVIMESGEYYAYHTGDSSIGCAIADEVAALSEHNLIVYLEAVHAFPGQGVSSSFKFGKSYGEVIGVLDALKVPYRLVSPQKWQKTIPGLPKKKGGPAAHKRALKVEACRRFPGCKPTLKTADAILIAEYGHRDRVI